MTVNTLVLKHFLCIGVGLMGLVLPLNGWMLSRLGSVQNQLMESKDTRIKVLSEVLNAIKVGTTTLIVTCFTFSLGVINAGTTF